MVLVNGTSTVKCRKHERIEHDAYTERPKGHYLTPRMPSTSRTGRKYFEALQAKHDQTRQLTKQFFDCTIYPATNTNTKLTISHSDDKLSVEILYNKIYFSN